MGVEILCRDMTNDSVVRRFFISTAYFRPECGQIMCNGYLKIARALAIRAFNGNLRKIPDITILMPSLNILKGDIPFPDPTPVKGFIDSIVYIPNFLAEIAP